MSLVTCSRDLASGVTAAIGGMIITTGPGGQLEHFETLGLLGISVSLLSLWIFRQVRVAE